MQKPNIHSMKLPNYLILSLVHCLIIISSDSKCLQPYRCGKHMLNFPLTDIRNPECGLFMVDGCNSTDVEQTIQLEAGAFRYNLLQVSGNSMTVGDSTLQKLLKEKSNFALRNVSLPKSPLASLTLASPKLTLFSGKNDPYCYEISSNLMSCPTLFTILYEHAASTVTAPIPKDIGASQYSMIQVPTTRERNPYSNALFDLLTHEFTLEWNVSDECSRCHRGGGQCLSNSINGFYCREESNVSESCYKFLHNQGHNQGDQCLNSTANELCKRRRSRLVLVLAISVGGLLFILCLLISYMIWLLKKRVGMGYVRSSNISFDTSKSDINGGSSFFGIPIFSYTDLEAATNNFDPSREIGDGGFGTVYYGKLLDGREVAIKRLYEQNCRRMEQFMNEIKILTCLRHPNLVCLYGCTSRRSRELLLVYEYVSNGTVADHLHGERGEAAPLTWPIRMRIAVETATALAYLHKSDIIHRDVKTDNILLDENFHVKVADFGLSRLFPNDATHISTVPGGTPGYIDPDYHLCYQVTDKSDVYSFGVVLVELISSMPAVDVSRQTNEINLANWALTRIQRGAFDELIDSSLGYNLDAQVTEMTTSVAEIAFRCLQLEKEMRPSMAEVLAFLRDISN